MKRYGLNVDAITIQISLSAIFGMLSVVFLYRTARRGLLSFQYTVGWLLLAMLTMVAGVAVPLITPIANFLAITPAALLAIGGTVLLVFICVQLSISISGLHERQRRLTEELAHLRQTVDTIDREETR